MARPLAVIPAVVPGVAKANFRGTRPGSAGSNNRHPLGQQSDKVMAKRPSWTGFLKLSLVTCPIQLFNATTHADSVSFHFINPKTRNRIQMKPVDPDAGEVERKDLVRGFEMPDGKYVTVTDEDLAEIRLKSTKTIEIDKFVDTAEIDTLYFEGAYFVMPDGPMAVESYSVIREAMKKERRAAQGRLVLSYREHVVIIEPRDKGMILHRMRDAREIIEQKRGRFELAEFKDPYEEALVAMLKRRAKGAKPVHEVEEDEKPTNVVNLMEALKSSLGGKRASSRNGDAERGKVVAFRGKPRPSEKAHASGKAAAKPRKRAKRR
jgi:DNA end-binding protein Ku